MGPLFTPPVVSTWPGPLGILMLPNITGGANWQGGSFDPETKMFYIFTNTSISSLGMVPGNPERNKDFAYIQGTARDPNAPPPAGRAGPAPAPRWRRPAVRRRAAAAATVAAAGCRRLRARLRPVAVVRRQQAAVVAAARAAAG